jgi:hypothetical protein
LVFINFSYHDLNDVQSLKDLISKQKLTKRALFNHIINRKKIKFTWLDEDDDDEVMIVLDKDEGNDFL